MTDMERKTFCAALSRYGAQAQITMAFEEMAELQDVLCKFLRGRVDGDTLANIAEEIADVGIMLDQMAIEFEVEDAVAEQRAHKVRRLRERIEKDDQPAADVAPVVHTRWAHLGGDEWCCPVCGFVITTEGSWDKPTKKYCEDCGAKMDGGADNG